MLLNFDRSRLNLKHVIVPDGRTNERTNEPKEEEKRIINRVQIIEMCGNMECVGLF
jgi:hypothetical protein